MSARYGNFVLYNPPLKPSTILLWFAPLIVIGIGSITLVLFISRRNSTASTIEISESARRRVDELTQNKQKRGRSK
jgi:cytochrome c-type biogenesis protein CcmH